LSNIDFDCDAPAVFRYSLLIVDPFSGFRRQKDSVPSPEEGLQMTDETSNGGTGVPLSAHDADAHGQAALLLVESLVHGLIARSVISVTEAVEIVDVAAEVRRDLGADMGGSDATLQRSISLLENISWSLRLDLPDG
jgi:hypothetical protein